jgi:hypothetical protein
MRYEDFLARVIDEGIADARRSYGTDRDADKRAGAVAGFEACRGKTPPELAALAVSARRVAADTFRDGATHGLVTPEWYVRCFELEVEWVCNVVSAALTAGPLLAHLPTARGVLKAAAILGIGKALEHG